LDSASKCLNTFENSTVQGHRRLILTCINESVFIHVVPYWTHSLKVCYESLAEVICTVQAINNSWMEYQNNQDSILTIVSGNKLHMNLYRTHWPYMKYHNNPRKGCLDIGQTRFPLQTDMSKLTAGYPLLPLHSCIWNVSQLCPLTSIGQ
jgi:hypothetical protein